VILGQDWSPPVNLGFGPLGGRQAGRITIVCVGKQNDGSCNEFPALLIIILYCLFYAQFNPFKYPELHSNQIKHANCLGQPPISTHPPFPIHPTALTRGTAVASEQQIAGSRILTKCTSPQADNTASNCFRSCWNYKSSVAGSSWARGTWQRCFRRHTSRRCRLG
jgi:hypothetical protein